MSYFDFSGSAQYVPAGTRQRTAAEAMIEQWAAEMGVDPVTLDPIAPAPAYPDPADPLGYGGNIQTGLPDYQPPPPPPQGIAVTPDQPDPLGYGGNIQTTLPEYQPQPLLPGGFTPQASMPFSPGYQPSSGYQPNAADPLGYGGSIQTSQPEYVPPPPNYQALQQQAQQGASGALSAAFGGAPPVAGFGLYTGTQPGGYGGLANSFGVQDSLAQQFGSGVGVQQYQPPSDVVDVRPGEESFPWGADGRYRPAPFDRSNEQDTLGEITSGARNWLARGTEGQIGIPDPYALEERPAPTAEFPRAEDYPAGFDPFGGDWLRVADEWYRGNDWEVGQVPRPEPVAGMGAQAPDLGDNYPGWDGLTPEEQEGIVAQWYDTPNPDDPTGIPWAQLAPDQRAAIIGEYGNRIRSLEADYYNQYGQTNSFAGGLQNELTAADINQWYDEQRREQGQRNAFGGGLAEELVAGDIANDITAQRGQAQSFGAQFSPQVQGTGGGLNQGDPFGALGGAIGGKLGDVFGPAFGAVNRYAINPVSELMARGFETWQASGNTGVGFGAGGRSRQDMVRNAQQTIDDARASGGNPLAFAGNLSDAFSERPGWEQMVYGTVFDPTNIVGAGFATKALTNAGDVARGGGALSRAFGRGADALAAANKAADVAQARYAPEILGGVVGGTAGMIAAPDDASPTERLIYGIVGATGGAVAARGTTKLTANLIDAARTNPDVKQSVIDVVVQHDIPDMDTLVRHVAEAPMDDPVVIDLVEVAMYHAPEAMPAGFVDSIDDPVVRELLGLDATPDMPVASLSDRRPGELREVTDAQTQRPDLSRPERLSDDELQTSLQRIYNMVAPYEDRIYLAEEAENFELAARLRSQEELFSEDAERLELEMLRRKRAGSEAGFSTPGFAGTVAGAAAGGAGGNVLTEDDADWKTRLRNIAAGAAVGGVAGFAATGAARGARNTPEAVLHGFIPGEKPDIGLLRQYEGKVRATGLETIDEWSKGNKALQDLGIGTKRGKFTIVERTPEVEALFKALHGEGPVPPRLQQVYDDIKRLVDIENSASLGFDPKLVPNDDYFYRGWRTPKEQAPGGRGGIGSTPGFKKQRVDATFTELLAEGNEPISWNPYDMLALRRLAGVEYREQMVLLQKLKDFGIAVKVDGAVPEGYRVPAAGPAFEGKPYAFQPGAPAGTLVDESVGPRIAWTDKWAVPHKVADALENMYAKKPNPAMVGSVDVRNVVGKAFTGAKRAKLMGSVFQQIDFATRQTGASMAGAVDALTPGRGFNPARAVKNVVTIPTDIGKLIYANISPGRRTNLRQQILSTEAILPDRPGVSLRSIAEASWSTQDSSLIKRDLVQELRNLADNPPSARSAADPREIARRVGEVERASQDGLFDGVYPQAQITALKKYIVPDLVAKHPDWTDAQISAAAATEVNKMFSTLSESQTVLKNAWTRGFLRSVLFSTNEQESLIRQAGSTLIGPHKALWGKYYLGSAISLGLTANAIHMAATGEPLPLDRYSPVDKGGPLGVRYNSEFLSPNIPLTGRNGTQIGVDLLGQMDTVLRVLDPQSFLESRFSIPLRAAWTQGKGQDFYGRPVKGPQQRIEAFLADTVEPIGAAQIRSALGIGREGESRLGPLGQVIQATGPNLRGEATADLRDRKAAEYFPGKKWDELLPTEKDEIYEKDPSFQRELQLRDEFAATQDTAFGRNKAETLQVHAYLAELNEQQKVADTEFQSGKNDDLKSLGDWKDNRNFRNGKVAGALDIAYGDRPPLQPKTIVDRYYAVIKENELPWGSIDWEKVDAWLGGLSAEDQAVIASQLGRNDTDLEKQYRKAMNELDAMGYFDRTKLPHYRNLKSGLDERLLEERQDDVTAWRKDNGVPSSQPWVESAARMYLAEKGKTDVSQLTPEERNELHDIQAVHKAQTAFESYLTQGRQPPEEYGQFFSPDYWNAYKKSGSLRVWLNEFATWEKIAAELAKAP